MPGTLLTEASTGLREGDVVDGRYVLEELISHPEKNGQGALSIIWKAREKFANFPVVLKITNRIRENIAVNEFRDLTAKLSHPNIVRTYTFGKIGRGGDFYLSMEYLKGDSIRSLLAKDVSGISAEAVLSWLKDMVNVLVYLHKYQFIHCDIKPANIMVDDLLTLKATMIDFNISEIATGFSGTPEYKCPIVEKNRVWSPFADVWALALTFYELLTGAAEATFPRGEGEETLTRFEFEPQPCVVENFPRETFNALVKILQGAGLNTDVAYSFDTWCEDSEPEEYEKLFCLSAQPEVYDTLPERLREEYGISSKNQVSITLALLNLLVTQVQRL